LSIEKIDGIGKEGYLLTVTPARILIRANSSAGLFYGVQTLLQTLPAIRTNALPAIPSMEVRDYPRFPWRGLMLDCSRHFFSPAAVREFIDLLAAYKMNTFHWHLTDDPGWRLEIKKYPKLTGVGAWSIDRWGKTWGDGQPAGEGEPATYGGYYTQEQVREIVAYAEARHITVVPEIEMPGHSMAALAAYPEYSCEQKKSFVLAGGVYPREPQINYCPGNDSVFIFIENVLTEVLELFPSVYIHVGGDEVDKAAWKKCPRCQARMRAEGLKNENELQSWFMRRIERFLNSKKRKMIGWDEILEGGLAPEATVMSWRGEAGGIEAAKMKHDVVMTPGSPCYFDHYQGDPETEPLAIGGFNTLKKVYDYEPVPAELNADEAAHVLGSQANLWTEYIPTLEHAEYMILPRMPAIAEVLWSPRDRRDWKDFNRRLRPHLVGFEQKGLRYSKGNFKVDIRPLSRTGKPAISLESENTDAAIYYTTDGSKPSTGSIRYTGPFGVDSSLVVKAVMALNNQVMTEKPVEQIFTFNKATGKPVKYLTPHSTDYPANGEITLTDGFRGARDIGKQWHAFHGNDMVVTVDLGESVEAGSMAIGCIQNWDQWIFFPQWVKFEVSADGTHFTELQTLTNTIPATERNIGLKDFSIRFPKQKIKTIRVTAKNLGECPPGHPGEKQPAWLFVDEIMVE
jgi:hexosaminidase